MRLCGVCQTTVALEEERIQARDALKAVLSATPQTRDELQKAIQQADATKLPQCEIGPARQALALEERRESSRFLINDAIVFPTEKEPNEALVKLIAALKSGLAAELNEMEFSPMREAISKEKQRPTKQNLRRRRQDCVDTRGS